MKKLLLVVASMATMTQIYAEKHLAFIDANFDDFANRMTQNEQERQEFRNYYANLSKKIQETEDKKRDATFRYLYKVALDDMEKKNADWFNEIKPFVSDPRFTLDGSLDKVREILRFFLTRYGAFVEYKNLKNSINAQNQDQVASNAGIFGTVKSYVSAAGNKIASIFGFGSQSA